MKRVIKFGSSTASVMLWRRVVSAASRPAIAIACCRAAQRDERKGYAFTAAMEWRKAATLLAALPSAAERCWKHWERIMHLPRRFAEPIGAVPSAEPIAVKMNSEPLPGSVGHILGGAISRARAA